VSIKSSKSYLHFEAEKVLTKYSYKASDELEHELQKVRNRSKEKENICGKVREF
jgi:predicted DNA repair protein MutK